MAYLKTKMLNSILRIYITLIFTLERHIGPLLYLLMRVWMARIFWRAGLSKIESWSTTLLLFENEYKVPLLPPKIAAYIATTVELTCPLLMVLGIATRLAVIPMLIMTAVIQFTYHESNEHLYWAVFLGLILTYGPGTLSFDFFCWKWLVSKEKRETVS